MAVKTKRSSLRSLSNGGKNLEGPIWNKSDYRASSASGF